MWNALAASLPDPVSFSRVYTLSNDVCAMQIVPSADGAMLSPVSRLPTGARIEACGAGFDEKTVKVCYEGQFYFVFLQDLEPLKKAAASAM
ncbi:MAG: hypothetical protein JOZ62_11995 [Acidobacteriaceae bacterium]|nr:hypothetical protein [Acidobacteriaceae bacterium]